MRMLFLTSEYPPFAWGGLGRYSREAVRALRELGAVDVLNVPSYYGSVVAAGEVPAGLSVGLEDGCTVVHACSPRTSELFAEGPGDLAAASAAACEETLPAALEALGPPYDVVYAQDYYTAPFAVRLLLDGAGRRLACMSHLPLYAGFTYFDKPHADEVHQALEALCLRFADVVVAPSRFAKRVLASTHAVDPDRIVVIGEGVLDARRAAERSRLERRSAAHPWRRAPRRAEGPALHRQGAGFAARGGGSPSRSRSSAAGPWRAVSGVFWTATSSMTARR